MVNELNLDPKTKIKVKDIEVELIEGDLEEKPWLVESENKNYVLLEEEQYDKVILLLKNILEENLEYKIEARIMDEFPVDFDDVKLVVKKEMEEQNLPLDKAVEKVKTDYPNLFHTISFDEYLSKL